MDDSRKQFFDARTGALIGAGALGGAALMQTGAHAQATDGIAEMTSAVTAIGGVKDAAIPIAVAVIVFSAGALVLKRLIYS